MVFSADPNSPHDNDVRPAPGVAADFHPLSAEPDVPIYRYLELSHNGAEVFIEYEGKRYRLRTTKNGKLILNK